MTFREKFNYAWDKVGEVGANATICVGKKINENVFGIIARKFMQNVEWDSHTIVDFSENKEPFFKRLGYLFRKYYAIGLNKREIKFLGKTYYYDNRFAPAILQNYPYEIGVINEIVNFNNVQSCLDVGANTGQFAFTLKSKYPHIEITSYEPNKKVCKLLMENSRQFKDWWVSPFGIGNKKMTKLYVPKNKSQEATLNKEILEKEGYDYDVEEVEIVEPYKRHYDFVKIDVEGLEVDVLKAILDAGITFNYVWVEVWEGNRAIVDELLKDYENMSTKFSSYIPGEDNLYVRRKDGKI